MFKCWVANCICLILKYSNKFLITRNLHMQPMKETKYGSYCDWNDSKMPFSFVRNNLVYIIDVPSSMELK